MAEKLKLCPFCGGVAKTYRHVLANNRPHDAVYRVECKSCGARTKFLYTEKEAIAFWNMRPEGEISFF